MNNILAYSFTNWLIETGDLGKGPGLWCVMHFILMFLLFTWMIGCFVIFRRHKKFALKVTKVVCYIMISFRIFRMLLLIVSGKETIVQAMPWHLCHIMAIVFPLFFGTKRLASCPFLYTVLPSPNPSDCKNPNSIISIFACTKPSMIP